MAYKIRNITDADKPRARVTIEETDLQGDPIPGRAWTENFDTLKKDWPALKLRFKKRIKEDDDKATAATNLITEGNNASLTDMA